MRQLLLLITVLFCTVACKPKKYEYKIAPSPENLRLSKDSSSPNKNDLVDHYNQFAIRFFKQLNESDSLNLIFSPHSINQLLLMAYAGSAGETEKEMQRFMGWQENNLNFHQMVTLINEELAQKQNDKYRLVSANKFFVKDGFELYQDFCDIHKNQYKSDIEALNFSKPQKSAEHINNWVATQTDSLLTNISKAEDFNPNTKLALINSCVFKGGWKRVFDKAQTYEGTFHGLVSEKKTDFMFRHWRKYEKDDNLHPEESYTSEEEKKYAPFLYNENKYLRVMEFPYADGEANMYIFLPQKIRYYDEYSPKNLYSWEDLKPHFQLDSILNLIENVDSIHGKMYVSIPKFKSSYDIDVKKTLSIMGLSAPFSNQADFSRMSSENLYIEQFKHQASIEVDEHGTAAAAATLVYVAAKSMQFNIVEFTANVPFYYLIRDKKTGIILFLGKYMQVE